MTSKTTTAKKPAAKANSTDAAMVAKGTKCKTYLEAEAKALAQAAKSTKRAADQRRRACLIMSQVKEELSAAGFVKWAKDHVGVSKSQAYKMAQEIDAPEKAKAIKEKDAKAKAAKRAEAKAKKSQTAEASETPTLPKPGVDLGKDDTEAAQVIADIKHPPMVTNKRQEIMDWLKVASPGQIDQMHTFMLRLEGEGEPAPAPKTAKGAQPAVTAH